MTMYVSNFTLFWYIFSTINAIDCMYSKLPPEDEKLIYSKHVEDIYWNKLRKKVHLVGSYHANISRCTVHIMSNVEAMLA